MGRLSGFRYREVIKRLRSLGFIFDRQAAGSHEIWYNSVTNLYTTIPNHSGEMPEGTLRAILKQAGVEVDTFTCWSIRTSTRPRCIAWWTGRIARLGIFRGRRCCSSCASAPLTLISGLSGGRWTAMSNEGGDQMRLEF